MNWQQQLKSKILTPESLADQVNKWREMQMKIVFTNGCFDILHPGHIDYLSKAAELGDVLLVGLNSDSSVKKLKGNNRPIQTEKARASLLSALAFVSGVVVFDKDTPQRLIEEVKPDVLVKGNDYTIETTVGADFVIKNGGNVIHIPILKGYSTSGIESKIKGGSGS